MTQQQTDEMYMRRCLQLARGGMLRAKPNPMVGAVIVSGDGRIIGEGYHRKFGEGHAEVNAFASVRPEDEPLLREATVYVSLEPCSHYGKTPPCADLIISKRVGRVVCGCIDPFARVRGRGVKKLRDAGISVTVGVLEAECLELNKRFITFNTHRRPYILLRWAQTLDGCLTTDPQRHGQISTPFTQALNHKLRAENDAILVGHSTWLADHPRLTTRQWSGPSPCRLLLSHDPTLLIDGYHTVGSPQEAAEWLYARSLQSLIVEGGARTIESFISSGLWDEVRVETGCQVAGDGVRAPQLPQGVTIESHQTWGDNTITYYRRKNYD